MSRGKNPRSKVLNAPRQASKPLNQISYPAHNSHTQTYEPNSGHQIVTRAKRQSAIIGLNIHQREIGEIEFKEYLPTFLRYADRITRPGAYGGDNFLLEEDDMSLQTSAAGGGIKIQIFKDDLTVASTLIPTVTWQNILKDILAKMSHIER